MKITNEAADYIKSYLDKESNERKTRYYCKFDMKLIVEKSGCNGHKYSLYPVTVGELCEGELLTLQSNGIHVWFFADDKPLVVDCEIELEKDLFGSCIKITNKTISVTSCGCGKSFHIE